MITNNNIQISFLIPAKNASGFLAQTLDSIHEFLNEHFKGTFEIILIINGEDSFELREMQSIGNQFLAKCPEFKMCYSNKKGKGAALREGFLVSKGERIFFTDADLPYDLSFFLEAYQLISTGCDLVSGNRRFSNSLFTLPVSVLPLAYGRHRIGVMFNRVVRALFKIETTDTQSGIKAFSRKIGEKIYSIKSCPGFLFDIEFFLVAKQNNLKHAELPVHLHLNSEKSTVRILKESLETGYWLSRIYFQNLRKSYRLEDEIKLGGNYHITADDWGLSPAINEGILKLAQKGVVTRVSMMADGLYLKEKLQELKQVGGIELGVHFNLTYDNYFKSPFDLLVTMISPFKRKAKELLIQKELERQFDVIKKLEIEISYADGHHHCHIFPVVVRVFSRFLNTQNIKESRLPLSWSFIFCEKILLLALSLMAKSEFDQMGIKYRPFYYPNFTKIDSSESLRKLFVDKIGFEIITHPSSLADLEALAIKDRYDHERVREFSLLSELVTQ